MDGLVYIGIGVVLLILIIIFKKSINKFYDNMKGLSESQAKLYKNFIIFLVPIILIGFGIYLSISMNLNENSKQQIVDKINLPPLNLSLIAGIAFILYGIVTFILRLTKNRYKMFLKLGVMEEKYGKIGGNSIHILGYTIAPIAVGVLWVLNSVQPKR